MYSIEFATMVDELTKEGVKKFAEHFGVDKPAKIAAFAPGRVNLIGEHTDYNDGFVFPMVRKFLKPTIEVKVGHIFFFYKNRLQNSVR